MAKLTQFGMVSRWRSSPAAHNSRTTKPTIAAICNPTFAAGASFLRPGHAPSGARKRRVDGRVEIVDRSAHRGEHGNGYDRDQTGDQCVFDHGHASFVRLQVADKSKHIVLHEFDDP